MKFDNFVRAGQPLDRLLEQSTRYRQLDAALKKRLPANLHTFCRVARTDGDTLVIAADNGMAASRLRMILPVLTKDLAADGICGVRVSILPIQAPPVRKKQAHLSTGARQALADCAERLSHHPQLAEALAALSRKK